MYRSSRKRGPPDTILVCRACGDRTNTVALEEARNDQLTCAACGVEQPVLPAALDEDAKLLVIELISSEPTTSYEQLVPFMRSLRSSIAGEGVAHDDLNKALQVTVRCDGIAIVVGLSISSGSVMGIELAVPAPGLPDMRLVREDHSHRVAKEKAISREVQTGDAAFDAAVYIESSTASEKDVRVVLAAPAMRAAVMRILRDDGPVIQISGGSIKLDISRDKDNAFDPATIRERLACLRVIAGAPRPIEVDVVMQPRAAVIAKRVLLFFPVIALILAIGGVNAYGPLRSGPYFIAAALGLVLAVLVQPIFTRALRGRSTSHDDILVARIVSAISCPVFMSGVLFIANATFDASPERVIDMNLDPASSSVDEDNTSKLHVTVWDDETNTKHSYTFIASKPEPPARARVRARWRSGALGWTWESGDPTLDVTTNAPTPTPTPTP